MAHGTVKWFNDAKGYGFITRSGDGRDVFVHYSAISGDGFRTLTPGEAVEYDEADGPKGLHAARVRKAGAAAEAEEAADAASGPGKAPAGGG